MRLTSSAGLAFDLNANGSVRRLDFAALLVNLFLGSELEGGPANIYLRRRGALPAVIGLLGPQSPARFVIDDAGLDAHGEWQGLRFTLSLRLAAAAPAWFWHATVENAGSETQTVDFVYTQDIGLAPFAAVRLNEFYISHYLDHMPLEDAAAGWLIASRQNFAMAGGNPWTLLGSLRRAVAFATDASQLYGHGAPGVAHGLLRDLPSVRKQHEHSLIALQDAALQLAPGERATAGFFGWVQADHPAATSRADLALLASIRALPEAQPPAPRAGASQAAGRTLFAPVRTVPAGDPSADEIDRWFGPERRHEERDGSRLLSFFRGAGQHVVLRAKERVVLRPHGHLLHTGTLLAPDERALTSTAWMQGVFHSMLTQGHVAINRVLSTVRSYAGLFRAHGQRVFVERDGAWWLLDMPSAFEMDFASCRWIYRDPAGSIEVRAEAVAGRHEFALRITVLDGPPARFMLVHHVTLDGDGGVASGPVAIEGDAQQVFLAPRADSELGRRFPEGGVRLVALDGTRFQHVGGDALMFEDGRSRDLPYVCLVTATATSIGVVLRPELVTASPDVPSPADATPALRMPAVPHLAAAGSLALAQLAEILPWYAHDARIHFLAPRGLEQFSGGGWGTRDVCQGPVELLLALDRPQPVRALLLRVFAAQSDDGDWPQWFMFFARDRTIRAGDSHGDIVFWPLLALAQYLLATRDATLLDARVPFFGAVDAEPATVWQHVGRALRVIAQRRIAGTELAAFGHGDWNDSLQPADPVLRDRLCSAWTVTLHHQMLTTLAAALHAIGRAHEATTFAAQADAIGDDFQRHLVADDVVTGYALFDEDGRTQYLLHPLDVTTGVRYSLLPMIHAILAGLFSPAQAHAHLVLIRTHLTGPDGARLFDRPLRYHGGLQKIFQRGETSSFFGREIGLMYMHAHLRYAEALAHVGDAQGLFAALARAHPLGLRERVPSADLRQANCYFSSSDAAFADRYEAFEQYARVVAGTVALEGGWRIYSSGPGIALGVVVRCLLGVRRDGASIVFDPVLPRALDGLRATVPVAGHEIEIVYKVRRRGGPSALRLNGAPLAFTRGANPYRTGGALVPLEEFTQRCGGAARNLLEIDLG